MEYGQPLFVWLSCDWPSVRKYVRVYRLINFFFVLIHMKYVVFVCRTIKILISNWPRTRNFSQLLQAGKTVAFDFSHHVPCHVHAWSRSTYGGEYWTKMELNKFIPNRVMHYIVPCGDIPSKTTNFSVDRYTIPDTSCYCIGHAPTSYRMLLYRAWCCQIVINVRR